MEEFQVIIDADLGREVGGVVAFGDFELKEGSVGAVYDGPTGLAGFFSDLLQGRPLPLVLATREVRTVGRLVTIALFLHRELAIHPRMPGLIAAADLADHLKLAGMAHIDPDLCRFFKLLAAYLPSKLTREEQRGRLGTAVEWIREYVIEDRLPALPAASPLPEVIDTGTGGFVVAESRGGSLEDGWITLFRRGFLWGLLSRRRKDDQRSYLAGRKSLFLALSPPLAAERLNAAEKAMGQPPGWQATTLWLQGPEKGSLLPPEAVVKVLIHE